MPLAGDTYLNGQLPQSHNPLARVGFNTFKVEIDPVKLLQQVIDFFETYGLQAISDLTGIDLNVLSPILDTIKQFIGLAHWTDPLNPVNTFPSLLQQLFAGLTGFLGGGLTPTSVGGAVQSQTAAIASLAAAVNALNAQVASAAGTSIAVDAFDTAASTLGANWDVEIVTAPFVGGGHPYRDGSQAAWAAGGFAETSCIARFIGTNHTAASDNTETAIVLGTPLSETGGTAAVDIHDRMSTDRANSVRARIETTGPSAVLLLHSRVSGVETLIGSQTLASQPPVGAICKLICGTATSSRQFIVTINGISYTFDEAGTTSRIGSGFRERGMGWFAGSALFLGQLTPGAVAHWTAVDITTPSGGSGGSGAGTGGSTLYDGGNPTATMSTVLDGGTPTATGSTVLDGGTP